MEAPDKKYFRLAVVFSVVAMACFVMLVLFAFMASDATFSILFVVIFQVLFLIIAGYCFVKSLRALNEGDGVAGVGNGEIGEEMAEAS